LVQPAQPVCPSGPIKPCSPPYPLYLWCLGPACQHAYPHQPRAWSPSRPCAAGLTAPARVRGGGGRTAQPARTPSRRAPVAHPRGNQQGERTPVPLPVTPRARWRPLRAGHVAGSVPVANPGAPRALVPLRRLDRAPTSPQGRVLLSPTNPHWGFAPFPVPRRR
jgi:hypothetical protein